MSLSGKLAHAFRCSLTRISPTLNTNVCYFMKFHKRIDWKNPRTLNEKIRWLNRYYYKDNPLIKQCADKYRVRSYIEEQGCSEILVPLLDSFDDPSEICWDSLPNQFAMKWNFGCGKNLICTDLEKLDRQAAVEKLTKMKKVNPFLSYSEFQYKDVEKKLIVEEYLSDGTGRLPRDYKVYCFNGIPEYVLLCMGRETGEAKYYFFDRDWNFLRISTDGMSAPENFSVPKPEGMDALFEYAEKLCAPFPFVRADFYLVGKKVYFGELTFTPGGGLDNYEPESYDLMMGEKITLPEKRN